MIKVAFIGAGSVGFTRTILADILAVKELQDTEFRFMDIDENHLNVAKEICRSMIKKNNLPAKILADTDRRKMLEGADYVFSFIRAGGLKAFEKDIEIPLKYGVDQCVGDTLGPGGVFYALRTIPVLLDIAKDIKEVCPEALFINYSNPMAMNSWALNREGGVRYLGLCHGVQGGIYWIAKALDLPEEEIDFICAGINHQTWYIKISHKGKDVLPHLLEAMENNPEIAHSEPCRIDVLRRFGYFSTESNGHLSEYLPWYRNDAKKIERWICKDTWIGGRTAVYMRNCQERDKEYLEMYERWKKKEENLDKLRGRSSEHGSYIIEALETGRPYRGHFNVENTSIITNLPPGCTVEVPCWVDRNGISPVHIGDLPMQCAALCRNSVTVQEMAVEAALTGNKQLVRLAVLMDPLTSAVLDTEQTWEMVEEMFQAQKEYLPQFNF